MGNIINRKPERLFIYFFQVNVAYTLGSIAKGADYQLKALIDSGIVPVLLSRKHYFKK